LAKFGRVVFELCEQTDRQTDRHTHHKTSHPFRRRSNNLRWFQRGYSHLTGGGIR